MNPRPLGPSAPAILKVARLGNPVLRRIADAVTEDWHRDADSLRLLDSMVQSMREYDGVGLAAPQIHLSIRVAVIEIKPNPRYPNAPVVPLTVLINPRIVSAAGETVEDWEGCLSVPGLRGPVTRHAKIEIETADENGRVRRIRAEGFFARAIQHELDHLDGKVYLDRMKDMSQLSFVEEFNRYHLPVEP